MNEHQQHDDLKTAREMQRALLPQEYPTFPPGSTVKDSAVRFAHYFEPNGTVGGDLFTVYPLRGNRVAVFICDVMGHGVRSALVTGIILGMLKHLMEETSNPARMLTRINHQLLEILAFLPEPIFTTAFMMVLDVHTGVIDYANAGHPCPLVYRHETKSIESLTGGGPALVLMGEDCFYKNRIGWLEPGDRILLYTDGLIEIPDASGEEFSDAGLRNFAKKHMSKEPEAFFETLIASLHEYSGLKEFPDDTCAVWTEFRRYV